MDGLNLFLSVLAVVLAGVMVYYQYYHKQQINSDTRILSFFRFLTLLGILLLLINPRFIQNEHEIVKPALMLAVDNSGSISHLKADEKVRQLVYELETDQELKQRFDISRFGFGDLLSPDTLLSFTEKQTNIFKAIEDLNQMSTQKAAPIVLISDGNQTYGRAYVHMNSNSPVYPVVAGDTVSRSDLEINLFNVNAFATLGNNFPVEVFLNYNGKEGLETTFIIKKEKKVIYSEKVVFTKDRKSLGLEVLLPADQLGMQLYEARLIPFEGEDNLINNSHNFGVEVIDEQTKVAVIYDIMHPDLGMIKRSIESNQQRQAVLVHLDELPEMEGDYSLFVLYQPNEGFKNIMEQLAKNESSCFIITGTHTDWTFLNEAQHAFSKASTEVYEDYFPVYANDFKTFYSEDLGFENFAPLKDYFGKISFALPYESLLVQSIRGINTNDPLLATFAEGNYRGVVLFGENIWKWRLNSYKSNGSFEKFDQFFNSLIQFLYLTDLNKDMDLIYDPVYHVNEPIRIKVKNYDSNLNPDLNSEIMLQFKDSSASVPFYVKNNLYETQISGLREGRYRFDVFNKDSKSKQSGSFVVVPFTAEQEKTTANAKDLRQLALNSKGQLFYDDQIKELKRTLLDDPNFRSVQKKNIKMISLIDWRWLLGLIVLSLSIEWLIRKYRGLT